MWFDHGNLVARVVRCTDEEKSWLSQYLSFNDATAFYRKAGNEKIRMFNAITNSFPAGFVSMIEKAAKDAKIEVHIMDSRSTATPRDANANLDWLYWYQREAVDIAATSERGVIWCPTGAGKTEVAIGITRVLPCRWLFLAHRNNLVEQAAARYELRARQHGVAPTRAGRVANGVWDVRDEDRFVTASFQTIAAAIKKNDPSVAYFLGSFDGIICDECHTLPSNSFWRVAMLAQRARYRFGLSGTPLARGDQKSLYAVGALGRVIYRVHTETLINEGVLARPTIRLVEFRHKGFSSHWDDAYGELVVNNEKRNALLVRMAVLGAKPQMLFVKEIDHGHIMVKLLKKAGIRAAFVWGDQEQHVRDAIVERLERGGLDVVVASVVLNEGIDIPKLKSVVMGAGGKSAIATLQRIGRGMRVERDSQGLVIKSTFEVFDVADAGCGCDEAAKILGTPGRGLHTGCKWLEKHSRDRVKAYVSESHQVTTETWVGV